MRVYVLLINKNSFGVKCAVTISVMSMESEEHVFPVAFIKEYAHCAPGPEQEVISQQYVPGEFEPTYKHVH